MTKKRDDYRGSAGTRIPTPPIADVLHELADELDSRRHEPGADERGNAAGLLRTRAIAEEKAELEARK